MRFLIDEDVPVKLLKTLQALGHDAVRVELSSPDSAVALRAKNENRLLITLDKDFTNIGMYPPSEFNIVHIHVHPPYQETIIDLFKKLLLSLPPDKFKGLIILEKTGHIRIVE